jgi:alpha-beta hydrolase superfamily lysophospholipase
VSGPAVGHGSVLLLHGMARSARSMAPLATDLRAVGYRIHNVSYPTRPHDIDELVRRYVTPVIAACPHDAPIHVVTHSLGGILIRAYLQDRALPAGSRIVMLAPPNRGSEVADHVRHWPPYRWWMGRVGQQLGTGPDAIVHRFRPIEAEVGVIAARRSLQPWFSWLLPGENDGAVSVASTRLDEMRDFIVVDSSHTLLMFSREVRRQVLRFLADGCFDHRGGGSALGQ